MSFARRAVFAAFALLTACSLFVDTGDLGGAPPAPVDAGAETASSTDGAKAFPPTATVWPTNGHAYEVVLVEDISWETAKELAEARGGHLATPTSASENDFIFELVKKAPIFEKYARGPFIGGRQKTTGKEPDQGWEWVTGEPWSFTKWEDGEPNDNQDEDGLVYYGSGEGWADVQLTDAFGKGYVVEYEP